MDETGWQGKARSSKCLGANDKNIAEQWEWERESAKSWELAQKVVKIYQVKFENENVAGSHFIAEAHQICMLSKQSEWATREASASTGE